MPVEERAARSQTAAHPPRTPARPLAIALRHSRAPVLAMAAVSAIAFVVLMYLGRGVGFYFDEWNFVIERRGHSAGVFLRPHNEHISVVPVLIYKVLIAAVGISHHWPYLAVLALMHVALGVGVFLLVRRRLGGWPAVMVATLILFMGAAWQNMIWAFQIGFVGSVLGGVWAWVALDRRDSRGDALACAALVLGTACSSLGVPLALGIGAEIVVQRRLRALWVAVVPLVLYGIWYLGYGESTLTGEGVFHAASWAVSAMAAAAAAPFGLGAEWGTALVIVGLVALGWRLTIAPAPPRLVGVLAAGGAFWLLTGAARSVVQPPVAPDSSRYLTLGSVVLMLAAVELARGVRVPPALLVYGAMITVVSVALGLPGLRDRSRQLRTLSNTSAAELGALELSAARAPADFAPDSASPQVRAGPYLAAVKDYGSSPADTPAELEGALNADRAQADQVLQKLNAQLTPVPARGTGGGCSVTRPPAGGPAIATATMPKAGIVVRATGDQPAQVKLRRFADGFGNAPIAQVRPGQPMQLRLPADASTRPYVAQVQSAGPVAICVTG